MPSHTDTSVSFSLHPLRMPMAGSHPRWLQS